MKHSWSQIILEDDLSIMSWQIAMLMKNMNQKTTGTILNNNWDTEVKENNQGWSEFVLGLCARINIWCCMNI